MADYVLRGTKKLLLYRRSLNVPVTREQLAGALKLPVGAFAGDGKDGTSYVSPRYDETKAQAVAALLGVSVANVTTNGGQEVVG